MGMRSDGEAEKRNARWIALWTTLITFAISLILLYRFDPSSPEFQFVEKRPWLGGTPPLRRQDIEPAGHDERLALVEICLTRALYRSAARLMAAHGFDGASISSISKESGLPASSIYWHFSSKDGVRSAVMERGVQRFFEAMGPIQTADGATAHVIENPFTPAALKHPIAVTLVLIAILGAIFLKGFKEAIGVAVILVAVYLLLNVTVIGYGLYQVLTHPYMLPNWKTALFRSYSSPMAMIGAALLVFPKLALGHHQAGGDPALDVVAVTPALHVPANGLHDREC